MASSTSRYYTRFIPREEIEDVTRWQFGAVGVAAALPSMPVEPAPLPESESEPESEVAAEEAMEPAPPPAWDEAQLQQMLQQAREEGYRQGLDQGQAQAAQEWRQRLDDYVAGQGREAAGQLQQLAQALEASFAGLQQDMAQDLLALACDIARQVVRQELSVNTRAMLPVVREALSMLVGEGRPATVRLHPKDWEMLERPLREEFGGSARIQWQADAGVAPGDCAVESAGMVIDGALEQRWRRAIAALGLTAAWREVAHGD